MHFLVLYLCTSKSITPFIQSSLIQNMRNLQVLLFYADLFSQYSSCFSDIQPILTWFNIVFLSQINILFYLSSSHKINILPWFDRHLTTYQHPPFIRYLPRNHILSWFIIFPQISIPPWFILTPQITSLLIHHPDLHLLFWECRFRPRQARVGRLPQGKKPNLWRHFTRFNSTASEKIAISQLSMHP